MMFHIWNSLDSLSKFNRWLNFLVALFGLLTGVSLFLIWKTNNRISELQLEKENELSQRIESVEGFSEKLKARKLTASQVKTLVKFLSPYVGQSITIVNHNPREHREYVSQFSDALKLAGWKREHFWGGEANASDTNILYVRDFDSPPAAASAM